MAQGVPVVDVANPEYVTLRDYFAAHAPAPPEWWMQLQRDRDRAANPHNYSNMPPLREHAQLDAAWHYEWADAMIAERARTSMVCVVCGNTIQADENHAVVDGGRVMHTRRCGARC